MARSRDKTAPSPAARAVLDATARGRVTYWPHTQLVIHHAGEGQSDVSGPFTELMQAGWALIPPYDLEFPPSQVPCHTTSAGDDALAEAARKTRKKEGTRR